MLCLKVNKMPKYLSGKKCLDQKLKLRIFEVSWYVLKERILTFQGVLPPTSLVCFKREEYLYQMDKVSAIQHPSPKTHLGMIIEYIQLFLYLVC